MQRKERIEKVCEKEGKNWEERERKMEKIERKSVGTYGKKERREYKGSVFKGRRELRESVREGRREF